MRKEIYYLFIPMLILTLKVNAQIFINETFKGNTVSSNEIILKGDAKLTSGEELGVNNGWLRLTKTVRNQRGYAFINKSFPSTLGTITEFEFKAWRNKETSYLNGDGFSVFLFDGSISTNDFRIGAYGGSLGYTRNTDVEPPVNNGLKGGFIAIGFDSYGGFGNSTEGKSGPDIQKDNINSNETPNSIILRGPTFENRPLESNKILAFKKLGQRGTNINNIRNNGELSYPYVVSTRPNDTEFYRKVKIEVLPEYVNNSRYYRIKVYMIKAANQSYSEIPLINYLYTDAIPENLKIGFAASTGGALNFHEIRNLKISTVGNLSVVNTVNEESICKESRDQIVEFKININNPTNGILNNVTVNNQFLEEISGDNLNSNDLEILSINYSPEILNRNLNVQNNRITGKISLTNHAIGIITVKAKVKKPNINILSKVSVSSDIIDSDLSNNTSTQIVNRKICYVNTNPMIYIKP